MTNEIEAENLARIKYGKMVVARGGVHSKPKRDEFEARIEAAYKQGYRDGRRELWDEIKRKRIAGGPRLGRPPKYEFSRLKVGGKLATTEHNTRNVYAAARQWAQRHAPSRRFRVRPAKGGCVVTRTT